MLKNILLIGAVCVDGFAAAVGIGSAGIKIPFRSAVIISLTGTIFLSCSIAFAEAISLALPGGLCRIISFLLLISLGIFNLLQNYFKSLLNRSKGDTSKSNPVRLFFDGAAADTDNSKSISCREALALSIALSADSLVTGVSAGLGDIDLPVLTAGVFSAGLLSVTLGWRLGRKLVSTIKINLGWLCGAVLIILAFLK